MAYRVQKECENVEHIIYEKNNDIGGEHIWPISLLEVIVAQSVRDVAGKPIPRSMFSAILGLYSS